jgi:tetratricopeptide (TPR) repeat protein
MTTDGPSTARDKRLAMLEAVIARGTDDPFPHYARALELRSLGRLDDALAAFVDVEKRFPGYVPTFLMAGQVAEQLDRPAEARGWLERGVERARTAGDAHALSELEQALAALAGPTDADRG